MYQEILEEVKCVMQEMLDAVKEGDPECIATGALHMEKTLRRMEEALRRG